MTRRQVSGLVDDVGECQSQQHQQICYSLIYRGACKHREEHIYFNVIIIVNENLQNLDNNKNA